MLDELKARAGDWTMTARGLGRIWDLLADERPQRILEFGSGLSTLTIAAASRELRLGAAVVSIDHLERFCRETERRLASEGLDSENIRLLHAPIRPSFVRGRFFAAYSPRVLKTLRNFGAQFVLVDGPPGSYRRDASLLLARDAVAPGATVVLDDINREIEHEAVREWQARFRHGIDERDIDFTSRVAVLRLPSAELRGWTSPLDGAWSALRMARALRRAWWVGV